MIHLSTLLTSFLVGGRRLWFEQIVDDGVDKTAEIAIAAPTFFSNVRSSQRRTLKRPGWGRASVSKGWGEGKGGAPREGEVEGEPGLVELGSCEKCRRNDHAMPSRDGLNVGVNHDSGHTMTMTRLAVFAAEAVTAPVFLMVMVAARCTSRRSFPRGSDSWNARCSCHPPETSQRTCQSLHPRVHHHWERNEEAKHLRDMTRWGSWFVVQPSLSPPPLLLPLLSSCAACMSVRPQHREGHLKMRSRVGHSELLH